MVSPTDLNPLGSGFGFSIGGMSTIATILVVIAIAVVLLGVIAGIVWWYYNRKKYYITIPFYENIAGQTMKTAEFRAKPISVGQAGDKLWYVKGAKKYLPPAEKQIAKHTYPHFKRKDGEWINFNLPNIDEEMEEADVKWVHQDMRAQRIATSKLLEKRLQGKSWFERWKDVIGSVVIYLTIAIALVIIFYQFSNVVEKIGKIASQLDKTLSKTKGGDSLVPAKQTAKSIIPLIMIGWGKLKNKLK